MSLNEPQPFVDSLAFNKLTKAYVPFQTHSDAMLASLQLFHDVPCRIMDLVFSVVTHPDFDANQVTLRSSVEMNMVVEESRVKDRLAVVHERSANRDGHSVQAGFPHFVLYEVLDIIHAERVQGIYRYLSNHPQYISFRVLLSNISLVHRSWTVPAQTVLGRILFLRQTMDNRDNTDFLQSPVKMDIFGPWTWLLVMAFSGRGYDEHGDDSGDESGNEAAGSIDEFEHFAQRFELLRRLLLTFTNLKGITIGSYHRFPLYTRFFTPIIADLMRQNRQLETLFLYHGDSDERNDPFILDTIANDENLIKNIRTLYINGPVFYTSTGNQPWKIAFTSLRHLKIRDPTPRRRRLSSPVTIQSILSTFSYLHLTSLSMIYTYKCGDMLLPSEQWATTLGQLSTLDIVDCDAYRWIEWIPHCYNLKDLTLISPIYNDPQFFPHDIMSSLRLPSTIQRFRLKIGCKAEILHAWKDYFSRSFCSNGFPALQNLSILTKVSDSSRAAPAALAHFHNDMNAICMDAGVIYNSTCDTYTSTINMI